MAKNDGGLAFPLSRETEGWYESGMSLRDYFAGQALVGLTKEIAENLASDLDGDPERAGKAIANGASLCYMIADAMLKERDRGG